MALHVTKYVLALCFQSNRHIVPERIVNIPFLAGSDQNSDVSIVAQRLETRQELIVGHAFVTGVEDKGRICEVIAGLHDQVSEI
jgi:hypothetical protein